MSEFADRLCFCINVRNEQKIREQIQFHFVFQVQTIFLLINSSCAIFSVQHLKQIDKYCKICNRS